MRRATLIQKRDSILAEWMRRHAAPATLALATLMQQAAAQTPAPAPAPAPTPAVAVATPVALSPPAVPPAVQNPLAVAALEILREECIACHRPGKVKGGLKLGTEEGLKKGGESGPVLKPGHGQESLLHEVLLKNGDPHMPPKKQLSQRQTDAIKAWIDAGAPWDAAVMDTPPKTQPVTLRKMPKSVESVLALAFSPNGSQLAVARGGRIEIRDAKQERYPVSLSFEVQPEAIQSLVWTPDGTHLFAGGFRKVSFWRTQDGFSEGVWNTGLVGQVTSLAFSSTGDTLWIADSLASRGGFLHKVGWQQRQLLKTWKAHEDSVYALALSADGRWLATAGADRLARRWDTATDALSATYEGHTNQVLGVAFDSLTPRLATTGADREIKVWDRESREQDAVLGDKKQVVSAICWSKDGSRLIGVTERGNGAVYSAIQKHTGEQRSDTSKVQKLDKVEAFLQSLSTTEDGSVIAAGATDGRIFVWKATDGKLQPTD
jgi:WD40 repeat protein